MKDLWKTIAIFCVSVMLLFGSAVALSGCNNDSDLDDAIEDVGEALEDAGEAVEDAAEDAGDAIDDQF